SRLRADPDRARERVDETVCRVGRRRAAGTGVHRRCHRRTGTHGGGGERPDGEHRCQAAAHGDGGTDGGAAVRAARWEYGRGSDRRGCRARETGGCGQGRRSAEVHPVTVARHGAQRSLRVTASSSSATGWTTGWRCTTLT